MRVQGVDDHRGRQRGERAGLPHQQHCGGCTRGKSCGITRGEWQTHGRRQRDRTGWFTSVCEALPANVEGGEMMMRPFRLVR
jgi:hypothetical protein